MIGLGSRCRYLQRKHFFITFKMLNVVLYLLSLLFAAALAKKVMRSCEHDKKQIRQYIRPPGTQVKVPDYKSQRQQSQKDIFFIIILLQTQSVDEEGKNLQDKVSCTFQVER
ncbi:CLUMA_CG019325, isoform A [Clunio marinus]|uniref:CLUMA_CG019325, isoform A n=1 Tax=Clunio marinus TaxID=568069 RepID=A0A1J1J2G4_9DIPT|nr:CLUMA_CG019325, isoform A [Clunio marinus]